MGAFCTSYATRPPSIEAPSVYGPRCVASTATRLLATTISKSTCWLRALLQAKERLPANRLCEIRYEDLVRDTEPTLRRIYDELELGEFDPAAAGVRAYLRETQGHQTRTRASTDDLAAVRDRWAFYYERYGYNVQEFEEGGRANATK